MRRKALAENPGSSRNMEVRCRAVLSEFFRFCEPLFSEGYGKIPPIQLILKYVMAIQLSRLGLGLLLRLCECRRRLVSWELRCSLRQCAWRGVQSPTEGCAAWR